MLSKTFNLLFFLKKPRNSTKGKLPIYIRITIEGKRLEISTQRSCEPDRWNVASGRKSGQKEDVKQLNQYLDSLQTKVYAIHRDLLDRGLDITPTSVKAQFSGSAEESWSILRVFKKHNDEMLALVGKDFAMGTYNRYEAASRNVKSFLKYKYKLDDMAIERLDYSFISDYAYYLKVTRNISHNVAMRYLKYFKKVVLLCVKHGWLQKDPFFAFKISFDEVDRMPLTREELTSIESKNFSNYRLRKVRDIFLFCCYTGLSYVDVKNLRQSNIISGYDSRKWVSVRRQKTNTPSRIPLLAKPLEIIQTYKEDPACVEGGLVLPVLTNQKMNSYLKEIGDVCGIDRPITFHLARHTFATTITLANDVPIETVSKMLGHKDLKTTQHYAKIVDRKISADMAKLSDRLQ
ncbi:site-specific integrase [Dyadobacter sp. CY261]|uniref:site-specific integrase n=1 Tax=Dyadobacter sp. CY261 TaxID=2907203 RepID=UPI001F4377CD|nr:site-specific integrase [Dyadobacter sp. CY261]MCF0073740.1 site-specific integrase [Dyadobacter sp. CY261]